MSLPAQPSSRSPLAGLGARFDSLALQPFVMPCNARAGTHANASASASASACANACACACAGAGACACACASAGYLHCPVHAGSPGWPALQAWCQAAPSLPIAVALPTQAARAVAAQRAATLALQLDGSHALAACQGAAARLALRLRVKWQDAFSGQGPRDALAPSRVWDSGRARDAAALAQLQPRRPSFIVVDQGPAAALLAALHTLQARSSNFVQPVRVLWLLPAPGAEAARNWVLLAP